MEGNLSYQEPQVSSNVTCGAFETEVESQAWLVNFLGNCQDETGGPFFKHVCQFRTGVPLFRHHRQSIDKDNYKCDVLALPRLPKFSLQYGAIVFEVKKSGVKIGPPLNQLKDYMASVFDVAGIQVVPSFGFLFPCRKQHSATASWMSHQSMGSVCEECGHVKFYSGEERLLEFDRFGRCIFDRDPRCGRGSGSR